MAEDCSRMPKLWCPLTVYRWRCILTHFPFLQLRPRGLLVFKYGGGVLENEKTLGTRLPFYSISIFLRTRHFFQFERAVALQFCVGLSQESRSSVIAHSQAVTTSRSNIYVFNKRLPTTCSVGGLDSFQNKLQGNCFHFYQICECKNFLELDFLWAFCQQFLTVKVLNNSSNNFTWLVFGIFPLC